MSQIYNIWYRWKHPSLFVCLFHYSLVTLMTNGPFPWNMLMTFTHAYRPCWLANAIELYTKQTRNRVCVTHPLAVYKPARCSLILPTKTLVRTRYVQLTYFKGRVYWSYTVDRFVTSCVCWVVETGLHKMLFDLLLVHKPRTSPKYQEKQWSQLPSSWHECPKIKLPWIKRFGDG